MTRRYLTILFPLLLAVLVGSLACVPMKDPQTIADINALSSKTAAASNCPAVLARDAEKTGNAKDSKTSRNLRDVCDCWQRATAPIELDACAKLAKSAATYEGGK